MRNYSFRLYPNSKQIERIERQRLLATRMYNELLFLQRDEWLKNKKLFSRNTLCRNITEIKRVNPDYYEAYAQVLQNCADRVTKSFKRFSDDYYAYLNSGCRNPGMPRFKKKLKSFTYPHEGFKIISGKKVWISRIGNIEAVIHRSISGVIKTLSVVCRPNGHHYFSISVEIPNGSGKRLLSIGEVGLDLGLVNLITLSSGIRIDNPRFFIKHEKRLSIAHKKFDRKQIGSKNWLKVRRKLAQIYSDIHNQREDYLHKLSNSLVNKYDCITIESLCIPNMV